MNISFSHLVPMFFTIHLAKERGVSSNTSASYADCMKLLVQYRHSGIEPEQIGVEMVSPDLVLEFLDHLEVVRNDSQATRNQRLACIKTFFHFLARRVPELMHANERIQAIRAKMTEHLPPPSLTVRQVDAIIEAADPSNLLGARDKALVQTLYNTGARAQEIVDLRVSDLTPAIPATLTLTGKGRRTRTVPLWPETVRLIQNYLQLRTLSGMESDHIFLNNAGKPMTRFGVGKRIVKYVKTAAWVCPSLRGHRISPHVFRHTTALHLIEAGNDITIVKDWLGHADFKTTSQYIEVSIERKRKAMEKTTPPKSGSVPIAPKWKRPGLMEFLTKLSRRNYVAPKRQ